DLGAKLLAFANKKARHSAGFFVTAESESRHILGLQALLALGHREFHLLTFGQRTVAFTTNRLVVHEHVRAATTLNESRTLGIVEPFVGSGLALSHLLLHLFLL